MDLEWRERKGEGGGIETEVTSAGRGNGWITREPRRRRRSSLIIIVAVALSVGRSVDQPFLSLSPSSLAPKKEANPTDTYRRPLSCFLSFSLSLSRLRFLILVAAASYAALIKEKQQPQKKQKVPQTFGITSHSPILALRSRCLAPGAPKWIDGGGFLIDEIPELLADASVSRQSLGFTFWFNNTCLCLPKVQCPSLFLFFSCDGAILSVRRPGSD